MTSLRLARALPWRRFKKGSTLVIELGGAINELKGGRFSPPTSLPDLCEALQKAAVDPRIEGVLFKLAPLQAGWGKLAELRRHIEYFNASGKWSVAYTSIGGEKEYYIGSAAKEFFIAPTASFSLRGFKVAGTYLRGVLDKVGVEPELVRIGKYKAAGDQLLRKEMSEPQAEQLEALLEDIFAQFTRTIAAARGKSVEEVAAMLDSGFFDQKDYLQGGWVDGLKYEDEVLDLLQERTGGKRDDKTGAWKRPPKAVALKKYAKVSPSAFGFGGKKRIAVIRTAGPIVGGSGGGGGQIRADDVIKQLRRAENDKGVAAVVLRVDSPGGDALASDLMWRAIRKLKERKPVIASMADVAASGGYYMAMGCSKIVAEQLTITGSIGVVNGKFNLAQLYDRAGYVKKTLSRGKWAELASDEKPFNEAEKDYFDRLSHFAYESFRDKAAESRGMEIEAMQERAQGRVWSGAAALQQGLIDAIGGVPRAIAIAKQAAGIEEGEKVRIQEVSRAQVSPLALVTGGASAASPAAALALLQVVWTALTQGTTSAAAGAASPAAALLGLLAAGGSRQSATGLPSDPLRPQLAMPSIEVEGAYSSSLLSSSASVSSGGLLDQDLLRLLS